MPPGILVQHARLADRSNELVRSDIAAVVGFIARERWPAGATAGDFLEIVLRREADLWSHPDRSLVDAASRRAVGAFFANGGDTLHLFGVCVGSDDDLKTPAGVEALLAPLMDRLRAEDDIALLLCPAAAYLRCTVDRRGAIHADADALYDALLAHCREMSNRFAVLDPPRALHGEPLVRWIKGFRGRFHENRSHGAVYYPWVLGLDGEPSPPSGAVAGTFARLEMEHRPYGVAWPPANTPIHGVVAPEVELDWEEAGSLSEEAINPLVVQSGRGVIAFGARTLTHDERFAFVNQRRVVSMITEQLRRDSEWAVFETNNPHLWDVLERDILFRLGEFAAAGMLSGGTPRQDYDAECNAETNLPALRNAGQVNVRVRLRPVGTVEHIVVDLRVGDGAAGGA